MNNYYDWYYMNGENNYLYEPTRKKKEDLFNPEEGFEKGNMFSNLYSEYKNYIPQKLIPRNEQEQKLYELQAICFAAHDLNLYLDLHKDDQTMLMLFKDYLKKEEQLLRDYEAKYGPMVVNNSINYSSFKWTENWPWEVKNV